MKITVVCGFFLPVPAVAGGGMEKVWFRLAREFARAGHSVTLFTRQWPGFPDRETIEGVDLVRLPGFDHTPQLSRNLLLDLWWGLRVARRLPAADVVVCNTVTLPIYLRWLRPGTGRVAVVLGRMPKGQTRLYGLTDRVLATSTAVGQRAVAQNPRLKARLRVFPNPIDWGLHQAAIAKLGPPAPLTVGYVGRLHPEKGVEILLDAAALLARRRDLPAWQLRLVGPQSVAQGGGGDAYVASLRARAAASGAAVSIEPPIFDPRELARVYGGLDVFCYPSLAEQGEGLSIAPIEAMAAAAVPVTSALPCYDDLIRDGANGLTFDQRAPDRSARLAAALARLLGDPEYRYRLAAQAAADARRFDYSVVAAGLLADFRELVAVRQGAEGGNGQD